MPHELSLFEKLTGKRRKDIYLPPENKPDVMGQAKKAYQTGRDIMKGKGGVEGLQAAGRAALTRQQEANRAKARAKKAK